MFFSKYAWVIPLKNKSAKEVVEELKKKFLNRIPKNLQTDKGTEFYDKDIEKLLKEKNIQEKKLQLLKDLIEH